MSITIRCACLGFLLVCWSAPIAAAAELTINIDTEITGLNLTGTALVPLASDPGNTLTLPDSVDGYGFVGSMITVTESPTLTSTGVVTLVVDSTSLDVTIDTAFDLFLDLQFDDVDSGAGRDYATGLGNPLLLPADAAQPLTVTLSSTVTLDNLLDFLDSGDIGGLGAFTSTTTVVYPLGDDVNANGNPDVMKLEATDVDLDIEDIAFSDIEINEADLFDFALGSDVTADISLGLSITSASLSFDGQVLDAIDDPPFSFRVDSQSASGPALVPEPSTFALLALGLLWVGSTIRRQTNLRQVSQGPPYPVGEAG